MADEIDFSSSDEAMAFVAEMRYALTKPAQSQFIADDLSLALDFINRLLDKNKLFLKEIEKNTVAMKEAAEHIKLLNFNLRARDEALKKMARDMNRLRLRCDTG